MSQPAREWIVKEALDWTQGYLEGKGDAHPLRSSRMLLSFATGLSHLELYTLFDRPLSRDERAILHDAVSRRGKGEPLQYITGYAPFRHLDVIVHPGVLIPRPETETLAGEVIERLRDARDPLVADIGCGSGCIACALATELPTCQVLAADISSDALDTTRENAIAHGVEERVRVLKSDLCASIPEDLRGRFDAVVSNPPYVPSSVMEGLPSEVKDFEPALALEAGEDGLDVFRRLLTSAWPLLMRDGLFAVELFEDSLEEAARLAGQAGYVDVRVVDDLAGRPRVLLGWKGEGA